MGTSTSNPGPTGRPPLLPPWAEPADGPDRAPGDEGAVGDNPFPEARPAEQPIPGLDERPSWNSPRRLVGGVASGRYSGNRGRDGVHRAMRGSVGAMGGGRGASRSASAGRRTAGRFATFLSALATTGIAGAAHTLGIAQFLQRSADVFLLHLADALAPSGALTEDAIAREAMDATLEELYERLDIRANGVNALERMTPALMADAIVRYAVNYIYERVIQALTAHIHRTATLPSRTREIEQTARQYIEDAVRADIDTSVFFGSNGAAFAAEWDTTEGQRVIDRLFTECYCVVEADLGDGRGRAA